MSLNIRGLQSYSKRKSVVTWLQRKKYDIVLLQETHSTIECEHVWRKEWNGPSFFSNGTNNSKGCMVLVRAELDFKVKTVKADANGRYIIIKCNIQEEPIIITNVYAPNSENEQVSFISEVDRVLTNLDITSLDNIIMGGDWNAIRDPEFDKCGGIINLKVKTVSSIDQLMDKFKLNDSWRIKNPLLKRYSWRQSNPLIQCRLDYWLISDSLYDIIAETDIIPSIRSDHSAITIYFKRIQENLKGPNFWKFNSSLLTDNTFTGEMKQKLQQWNVQYDNNDKRVQWELIKYEIRKFSIKYSKIKQKEVNREEKELELKLISLERSISRGDNLTEYNEVKQKLETIENERVKGIILRSKVQWHEEGEKSTKYFLGLEKSNAIKKHIRKLKMTDGTIITDPKQILGKQVEFYKNLYCSKIDQYKNDDINLNNVFEKIKKLNDEDREKCEGLIAIHECESALKVFAKNKSPGNDGITAEFYQYFWPEIKDTLVECYNYAYDRNELSASQKQAIISLVDKKDKDRLKLENWRPISLLNIDYKIASKVITNRLHDIIPKLLDINQTGFIKGRFMGDTIRTLLDVIDYCKSNNEEGMLMMIDFEKAFDSLEWDFLFKTLENMNFGDSFIKWVKLFYTNIESCISNNGTSSKYFQINRGVRQGDPLSAYLFILSVEVMAQAILKDDTIHGIRINGNEIKLTQYADDTTAILKDQNSVHNFLKQVHSFEKICGLKINTLKTEAIWLGNQPPPFKLPNKIQWTTKPIKVLGIYIGWNLNDAYNLNYSEKLTKIKRLLQSWLQRTLSLTGKVLIIKSLAISQIIHFANLLPFPDDIAKQFDELFYNFIWHSKTHKVKKTILIQDYHFGGQQITDLRTMIKTQKIKWIKFYLNNLYLPKEKYQGTYLKSRQFEYFNAN